MSLSGEYAKKLYDWRDRNQVIYHRREQSGMTFKAIADEYGLSMGRVHQIYLRHKGRLLGMQPTPQRPHT